MSLKLVNNHKHVYLTVLRVVVKYISQYFCKIIYLFREPWFCTINRSSHAVID